MIPETIDLREWHLRELMRLMLAPWQVTRALAEYLEANEYGLAQMATNTTAGGVGQTGGNTMVEDVNRNETGRTKRMRIAS